MTKHARSSSFLLLTGNEAPQDALLSTESIEVRPLVPTGISRLLEIKTYSSVCSSSLSFVLSLSKRLSRLNFSTGKDRACVRAHLRRCLYTVDSLKRLTHTLTHTRKRADGSSGNMGAKEYFNSSGNGQKRLENNIFRIFLLFVISRSGVRIRLPAPFYRNTAS